jgi:predicted RNA-binding Zn-ribbon protein involved in translation (DUF1610 family)
MIYSMGKSIVRATCPGCGDVVLATADLSLDLESGPARYRFTCPGCAEEVSHEVAPAIVHILQAAGVRASSPQAGMVTDDEMAMFLADFERPDCLDQLRRSFRGR